MKERARLILEKTAAVVIVVMLSVAVILSIIYGSTLNKTRGSYDSLVDRENKQTYYYYIKAYYEKDKNTGKYIQHRYVYILNSPQVSDLSSLNDIEKKYTTGDPKIDKAFPRLINKIDAKTKKYIGEKLDYATLSKFHENKKAFANKYKYNVSIDTEKLKEEISNKFKSKYETKIESIKYVLSERRYHDLKRNENYIKTKLEKTTSVISLDKKTNFDVYITYPKTSAIFGLLIGIFTTAGTIYLIVVNVLKVKTNPKKEEPLNKEEDLHTLNTP